MLDRLPHLAVMVGTHGRGSNMAAIAQAILAGNLRAEIAAVVGSVASASALDRARELGLPVLVVPFGDGYAERLARELREANIDMICLAGYMRLLPAEILATYPTLNIHPALLPKFGGKGMYGKHVHEAVLAAGEKESGCTVHRVTPVYDEGEIILQCACPVEPDDTPDTLANRVLALEHTTYPRAIGLALEKLAR